MTSSDPMASLSGAPDVVKSQCSQGEQHGNYGKDVDLIDFSSESLPGESLTLLEMSQNPAQGLRDSAFSSGSSARDSTLSNFSTCSSGADFAREGFGDNSLDFGGIPEEQGSDNINFRKRTSRITHYERDSVSSGTIIGLNDDSSNRDSQASFASFNSAEAGTLATRSSSSSAQEEDFEQQGSQDVQKQRKSFKGKILQKSKSLGRGDKQENVKPGKELRRFRSVSQGEYGPEKAVKKETFFGRIKKRKRHGASKQSGVRVYSILAEDSFNITQSIPHPTVEEKTPKG